ncbi:hypothetical protein SK128_026790 [Halocaridina rubra]|uniref:Uncharacterized protein n=1 Tax=Halocaridina rubra TaxID=373956 RepID=A0AAN9A0T8_HALRR
MFHDSSSFEENDLEHAPQDLGPSTAYQDNWYQAVAYQANQYGDPEVTESPFEDMSVQLRTEMNSWCHAEKSIANLPAAPTLHHPLTRQKLKVHKWPPQSDPKLQRLRRSAVNAYERYKKKHQDCDTLEQITSEVTTLTIEKKDLDTRILTMQAMLEASEITQFSYGKYDAILIYREQWFLTWAIVPPGGDGLDEEGSKFLGALRGAIIYYV